MNRPSPLISASVSRPASLSHRSPDASTNELHTDLASAAPAPTPTKASRRIKLDLVVCACEGIIGGDGSESFCKEAVREWSRAVVDNLLRLPFVNDVDLDYDYRNWRGGKYGCQSSLYGYKIIGEAVCTRVYRGGRRCRWDSVPANQWAEIEAKISDALIRAGNAAEEIHNWLYGDPDDDDGNNND